MQNSMPSIAVPTRIPRAHRLGILAGITNMTRLNRLGRLAGSARLPIPGGSAKW